jgi:hypothetical protein
VKDLTLDIQKLPEISGTVQFAEGCNTMPVKATAWVDSPLMEMGPCAAARDEPW